jgi:hypothetical protein
LPYLPAKQLGQHFLPFLLELSDLHLGTMYVL